MKLQILMRYLKVDRLKDLLFKSLAQLTKANRDKMADLGPPRKTLRMNASNGSYNYQQPLYGKMIIKGDIADYGSLIISVNMVRLVDLKVNKILSIWDQ